MKILTKNWAEKQEQLRVIHWLKEYCEQKESYEDIKSKSRDNFFHTIAVDVKLSKAVLKENIGDELYQAQLDKDKLALMALPKEISSKIKNMNTLLLGYACKDDKVLLTSYAKQLLIEVEKLSDEANRITEIAEDYLPEEVVIDDVVGELVFEEYSKDNDYFIKIGGYEICIENYSIIERENFVINEWEQDNPLTLWTALHAAELHYISDNCYELHLLLVDGDKYANEKYWYFTLKGTNIKFV
ncbi:MAG: hypothetical protein IJW43_02950 [Clostridia bacterium]|nr:hypothetical protein [Clostridia bacterium]